MIHKTGTKKNLVLSSHIMPLLCARVKRRSGSVHKNNSSQCNKVSLTRWHKRAAAEAQNEFFSIHHRQTVWLVYSVLPFHLSHLPPTATRPHTNYAAQRSLQLLLQALQERLCKHLITRLPSNLRPTTRKCVHLVALGHFRSRDKDSGDTVWSAVAKHPMLMQFSWLHVL